MTEKQFQNQIITVAKLNGWKVYHTYDSRRSEAGFPDLTLVRGGKLIFAELKTDKGKVTPAQEEWIFELSNCVPTYVWRPHQWDEILKVLGRRHILKVR